MNDETGTIYPAASQRLSRYEVRATIEVSRLKDIGINAKVVEIVYVQK